MSDPLEFETSRGETVSLHPPGGRWNDRLNLGAWLVLSDCFEEIPPAGFRVILDGYLFDFVSPGKFTVGLLQGGPPGCGVSVEWSAPRRDFLRLAALRLKVRDESGYSMTFTLTEEGAVYLGQVRFRDFVSLQGSPGHPTVPWVESGRHTLRALRSGTAMDAESMG